MHSYIIDLMMGAEVVPEILVSLKKLTQLIAQEDFINFLSKFAQSLYL
jgi:hypothetical protein